MRLAAGVTKPVLDRVVGDRDALSSYARLHRHRVNLLIHLATVPMVHAAVGITIALPFVPNWEAWWGASVAMTVYAALLQRFGHRLEGQRAATRGAATTVRNWVIEQFVVFPLFVATGGWRRNWIRSRG